jgi:integrase
METLMKSAGDSASAISSAGPRVTASPDSGRVVASFPSRDGSVTVSSLIDAYLSVYAGRDGSRLQRLSFWVAKIGSMPIVDLTDDHVFYALEELEKKPGRFWAGKDADGNAIYKSKRKPLSPATINRYAAALGAVLSWSIKKRLAPRGWDNPCRRIERREEDNEVVRFLSDAERVALMAACKASPWRKLYLLVLLAITTGARRGELQRLRWRDVDFERNVCSVSITKNGDPKLLPLVEAAKAELEAHLGAPTALVFASTRRPDVAYNNVAVWKRALKTAGVRNFRFHDLRHSCASYLAQSGATLLEIGDVLGHRQLSVTKRYSHLTTKNKADLVNRVLGRIC